MRLPPPPCSASSGRAASPGFAASQQHRPRLLRRRTARRWLPVPVSVVLLLVTQPAAAAPSAVLDGPPDGGPVRATPASRTPMSAADGFRWPVDAPPRPVRRFDPPPLPWLPGHRGVDLAVAVGAPVRAAGPGTVLFAGMVAGRPVVTVGHADGLRTTYEPVRPTVAAGDPVPAGAPLGVLQAGHAGCPAAACLHWGLRRGEEYLDPLALLGLGPVRLLPLDGSRSPAGTAASTLGEQRW
ncbi:M23 family metallopeptidase [Micromonospora sp. NPDC005367]|uniref:murein hydrolase activator EnvC family protein n=1 Tax=Micromonospora sp. NPDC005367 TaxID=3155590 RepID=UPI0033A26482